MVDHKIPWESNLLVLEITRYGDISVFKKILSRYF